MNRYFQMLLLFSLAASISGAACGINLGSSDNAGKQVPATNGQSETLSVDANSILANNLPANSANAKPSPTPKSANAVCPHPDKPCKHKDKEFAEWELSFRLPAKIIPNKTYKSAPFYAVMFKTYKSEEDCDGGEFIIALEDERKEFQQSYPDQKVFASYACPNMDAVDYEFEGKWDKAKKTMLIENFIAIYAGTTEIEAEVLRRSVRDEYPKAVIKRMTASWERIEQ